MTGIGRVQVLKAIRPYARCRWAADRYNIFGYWNSRTSLDPQFALSSGPPLEERSDIFHIEGQQNWNFQEERGRVVYGASLPQHPGEHLRHADEPGQRRPERRLLLRRTARWSTG